MPATAIKFCNNLVLTQKISGCRGFSVVLNLAESLLVVIFVA